MEILFFHKATALPLYYCYFTKSSTYISTLRKSKRSGYVYKFIQDLDEDNVNIDIAVYNAALRCAQDTNDINMVLMYMNGYSPPTPSFFALIEHDYNPEHSLCKLGK